MQAGVELTSNDRRWKGSLLLTKRKTWRLDFNTVAEISWQFPEMQTGIYLSSIITAMAKDCLTIISFPLILGPEW